MNTSIKTINMKSKTVHEIWTEKEERTLNNNRGDNLIYPKGVYLANQLDPYYMQIFQNKSELDHFIKGLQQAKKEVFGED